MVGQLLEASNSVSQENGVSLKETTVTASRRTEWDIDQTSKDLYPTGVGRDLEKINQVLSQTLTTFSSILGPFPYVSITFAPTAAEGAGGKYSQIHLTRPGGDENSIAVDFVPNAQKGARYSDISMRVFGDSVQGPLLPIPESIGGHFTLELARELQRFSYKCQESIERFQKNDIVLQMNPQGVQEYVNQPLGGIKDTGGQNKYVECFARSLGKTIIDGKECAPSQVIFNRSGPSQREILAQSEPPEFGGDPAMRKGLHFFPDENVCLAFVEDEKPEVFQLKEDSHPKWKLMEGGDDLLAGFDTVIVKGGKLEKFGIQDGTYLMTDPGPMKQLAESSAPLLDYFKLRTDEGSKQSERKIVLANHYADAAYLGEFVSRELSGSRLKNFFFLHSLGTFKAEGLDYPNKLMSETGKAKELESKLRLTDRILGELWIVQKCEQDLIANSDVIAQHAHEYLGSSYIPPTMIAVDDSLNGHIARSDREALALETFKKMHELYLQTCDNPVLGPIVPVEKRLTLSQLIDAQIVFERSRHAEADSKGKWAVVKAMAIAQSDPRAQSQEAPDRVLIVNVNLAAKDGPDRKFRQEISTIINDVISIRKNGGHVIIQPSYDYHLGLNICKICDVYMTLPSFEPFGMGGAEAGGAGAVLIARSDVPAIKELFSQKVADVKFPLRNSSVKVGIAEGAILVGGHPDSSRDDPNKFAENAYNGAAAAINAVTLGIQPTTQSLVFNHRQMGDKAADIVRNSEFNWANVARRFLRKVFDN